MGDVSKEVCKDSAYVSCDLDGAFDHVFSNHFDVSFWWKAKYAHAEEDKFKGDSVKVFLFVMGADGKRGLGVLQNMLNNCLPYGDDVSCGSSFAVGIYRGGVDFGFFSCLMHCCIEDGVG